MIKKALMFVLGDNIYRELAFVIKYYHFSLRENKPKPLQIYCLDGKTYNCGFADRLRGMITTYAFAKANGYPFRIKHDIPFKMEDFFTSNRIDWTIKEGELSCNIVYSNPIVMIDHTKGNRLCRLSGKRQHHFYTNINALALINKYYGKNYKFSDLFSELFRPSVLLEGAVKPYIPYIEEGYISVSFRFMQLMGDFIDICGDTLSIEGQEYLTQRCLSFIDSIKKKHSDIKYVFVTTDSTKFLARSKSLDYVFTIPGEIGHIGFHNSTEVHLKTILDFYLISKARKAYMGYTGKMYKSHFAESAAEISGIPYEGIEF